MIDYIEPIFEGLKSFFYDPKIIIMWIVAAILFYFGIVKKKKLLPQEIHMAQYRKL